MPPKKDAKGQVNCKLYFRMTNLTIQVSLKMMSPSNLVLPFKLVISHLNVSSCTNGWQVGKSFNDMTLVYYKIGNENKVPLF